MAGLPFAPAQNGERSPNGGGGGGKVRTRRAQKRNATPYDRPAVGRHASAGPQAAAALINGNGAGAGEGPRRAWLGSGLLGTASKIVTTGASYLYSSIFKRRDEPLRINDVYRTPVELVEGQADASPSAAEAESTEGGSRHMGGDKTMEVERWMKRIFPRDEADRLIGILRSSVKENGIGEEKVDSAIDEGRIAITNQVTNQVTAFEVTPNNGPRSDAQRWREERTKARQEQKNSGWVGGSGLEDCTPTEARPFEDGEAMDSSPINLARAYMGERVTKLVGPPRLTLTQEKTVTPHRVSPYQPSAYRPRNRQVAHDQEGKMHFGEGTNYSGQLESPPVARYLGLPLPVAVRGHENMFGDKLRTPPLDRTIVRITAGPHTIPPGSAVGYSISREGSKKRGSSALEDVGGGYSSGGPIRRLRPRSSLYTPSPASTFQRRGGMSMYPPPSRIMQTPIVEKQKQSGTWCRGGDTEMKSAMLHSEQKEGKSERGSLNFGVVQSETARKILETLDMMTPSPKEKSLDTELALLRERPPTELTASMMNEKARQTMESWDYPGPHQDEEPGPSGGGRNLENDLSLAGEVPCKGPEHGMKSRIKGKAPASSSQHSFQDKSTDQGTERLQTLAGETPLLLKESFSSLANAASSTGRNKGFQINADVDDSDEDVRGGNINVQTTRVMSTSTFSTGLRASSGAGSFVSIPAKAVKCTTLAFGSTLASESQMLDSESGQRSDNSDGKPSVTVPFGGFTFPSSNLSGGFMEAPPTPKPFPSPSLIASAPSVTTNGGSTYQFNTRPSVDKPVFTLPPEGTTGAITTTVKPKFEVKTESREEFSASGASPAVLSGLELSTSNEPKAVQVKQTESSKKEGLISFGSGVSQSFSSPSVATSSTSTFSLSNFGAPGAGAKSGLFTAANNVSTVAGVSKFGQTAFPNASIFGLNTQAQTTSSVTNTDASSFAFGNPPTASLASETPTTTAVSTPSATSSIFGTSTSMTTPTTVAAASFGFGSAPAFGQSRSTFGFGATPSATSGFGVQSSDSLASLSETSKPQKKMFGQLQSQDSDRPAGSGVTFGLSSTATTSTSTPSSGGFLGLASSSVPSTTTFSIPSFGQSSSSPADGFPLPAIASKPLFGLPLTSTTSAPAASSSCTPAPATLGSTSNPFGASSPSSSPFGSSVFGVTNGGAPFGGAPSSPAFGGSSANNKSFGGFSSEVPSQGSTPAPLFSGFGAPATLGAGSSPSTFSFGGATGSASSPSPFGLGAASSASSATASTTSAIPFSFGAPGAPSSSAFSFGGSGATTIGNHFALNSKPVNPTVFGLGSSAPAFGPSSPIGVVAQDGSGENNMEDSMAEESHMMGSPPPAPQAAAPVLFGTPQTPSSGTFLFGKQPSTASPGVFSFGNPQTPPAAGGNTFTPPPVAVNPFATPPQQVQQGGLNFGGGGFNVGTSGQENSGGAKTTRKFIKAKRTGSVKRK